MSKMIIVEGNSNDKDNVRAIMVKGEKGYSAYDLYVQNGGTLTEEEWLDAFLNAENYYNKSEVDNSQENQDTKLNKKPYYYNTVADMKSDNSLKQGDMAVTLGYYSVNDGGNASYRIVNDESETDFQETLGNGKYASLIIENGEVNVNQCGAYGDGTHDDYDVLNYIFNNITNKVVKLPRGTYLISDSLNLNGEHITINGDDANIIYTGNDYAIISNRIRYGNIKIGNIEAMNGGCIKLYATEKDNQFVYLNIFFQSFKCLTDCVYAYVGGQGFINELRWFYGKLLGGQYGFRLEHDVANSNSLNGWKFEKIGVEGVNTGYYFNAIQGDIRNLSIIDGRNVESFDIFLKTQGTIKLLNITGSSTIYAYKCNISFDTTQCIISNPIVIGDYLYTSAVIEQGKFIGNTESFPNIGYAENLENNSDLNDLLIPGTYATNFTSNTITILNKPVEVVNQAIKVFVINKQSLPIDKSSTYVRITQILLATQGIFYRNVSIDGDRTNPTFTNWEKLSTV